jgi:hypothetical protein
MGYDRFELEPAWIGVGSWRNHDPERISSDELGMSWRICIFAACGIMVAHVNRKEQI